MNESKATRFQRLRRRSRVAGITSAAATLAALGLTPGAAFVESYARAFVRGVPGWSGELIALFVFACVVVVVAEVSAVPALWYFAARTESSYGGRVPVEEVFLGELQSAALTVPIAFAAFAAIFLSAGAGPWWWIVASLYGAAGLAAALRVGPTMLAALAGVRPIQRQGLADRLDALASRTGIVIDRIDEWLVDDASPATAAVAGVGRRRRVLLASEIVRHWPDDEIAVIVAHELAHHRHGDLWRAWALNVVILAGALLVAHIALGTWYPGRSAPDSFAAVLFVAIVASAVWIAATPVRHAQSRGHERKADVFALAMTGRADAFGAAVRRLGSRTLAEERPSTLTKWLHHRHPSVAERLALAEAFRRVSGS